MPRIFVYGPSAGTDPVPARFNHDCDQCRYLGQIDKYDLYVCKSGAGEASVIFRYGDDGPNYASTAIFASTLTTIQNDISGLTDDELLVYAAVREMPSILLNIWKGRG
jgi:hypothetical protein